MNKIIAKIEELENRKANVLSTVKIPCADATDEQKAAIKHCNESMYVLACRIKAQIRGMVDAAKMLGVTIERDANGKWYVAA